MEFLADPTLWIGLSTLVLLEIVLGIDNLIFIAILAEKLPPQQRDKARIVGLGFALVMRLLLLAAISWLVTLTQPLFTVLGKDFSGRDLIFFAGGLFLLFKATKELHERLETRENLHSGSRIYAGFWSVVTQIVVLDAVFSIDSVITAIGMVDELPLMMAAVVIAIIIMAVASKPLTKFVNAHPTVIVLCLGFLMMIGFSLIAEGAGFHIPKGYLYAAIGFSVLVEAFNQTVRVKRKKEFVGMSMRDRTAEAVLRLLGGRAETAAVGDEIEDMVAGVDNQSAFAPEEMRMLERVMNLSDIKITSLMTHRHDIIWIDTNETRSSILEKIKEYRHSRYPLCDGSAENPLGILVVKDLLLHAHDEIDLKTLVHQPISMLETTSALKALELFKKSISGFAMVVDEYGGMQGIVTLKDVMEAIVGNLPEPSYRDDYNGIRREDGSWLLDGGLGIHEVEEMLGVRHMDKDGDFDTLAGFVVFHLNHIPTQGEYFYWNNLVFEIIDMDRNRVDKVLVKKDIKQ
jgi:CBS domain containing-hemolysin-like protein